MDLGNGPDDRKPDAAAVSFFVVETVEALEHPIALLGRDPRPGVLDNRQPVAVLGTNRYPDLAGRWSVAHRVVDQVAQQRSHPELHAGDLARRQTGLDPLLATVQQR